MNPTLILSVGEPTLITCPEGDGAAYIKTFVIEWTGERFNLQGRIRCTCCSDPPRVRNIINSETSRTEWVKV